MMHARVFFEGRPKSLDAVFEMSTAISARTLMLARCKTCRPEKLHSQSPDNRHTNQDSSSNADIAAGSFPRSRSAVISIGP
jgi:hypothetical protein